MIFLLAAEPDFEEGSRLQDGVPTPRASRCLLAPLSPRDQIRHLCVAVCVHTMLSIQRVLGKSARFGTILLTARKCDYKGHRRFSWELNFAHWRLSIIYFADTPRPRVTRNVGLVPPISFFLPDHPCATTHLGPSTTLTESRRRALQSGSPDEPLMRIQGYHAFKPCCFYYYESPSCYYRGAVKGLQLSAPTNLQLPSDSTPGVKSLPPLRG